jgi:hypothetical protein
MNQGASALAGADRSSIPARLGALQFRAWTALDRLLWSGRKTPLRRYNFDSPEYGSGLEAMENGRNLAPSLFPRNRFYLARIQFFNAACDFFVPLFFGASIDRAVDAFKK